MDPTLRGIPAGWQPSELVRREAEARRGVVPPALAQPRSARPPHAEGIERWPDMPPGMTPLEQWAWKNGSEGTRRRMAWAYEKINAREKAAHITWAEAKAARTWEDARKLHDRQKAAIDATPEGQAARTKRERKRRYLEAVARPCFVRFRDPPPDGISRNHFDGTPEVGLSVFEAYEIEGKWVVDPAEDFAAAMALLGFLVAKEPAYLATGTVVGSRPWSGEAMLSDFCLEPIPREKVMSLWEYPRGWRIGAWIGMWL